MTVKVKRLTAHQPSAKNGLQWVLRAFEVRDQRKKLAKMSDEEMKDIGITHADRDIECQRHFWDF